MSIGLFTSPSTGNINAEIFSENFNLFTGSGFAPTPSVGQLDSDLWVITGMSDGDSTFGGTHTSGDFARGISSGGTSTGGTYAFNVGSSDYILGVQPAGSDFTPGEIKLKIVNIQGYTLTGVTVDFDFCVINNEDRANSFVLGYSEDDTSYTDTSVSFTTPEAKDASPTWSCTSATQALITGINVANGNPLYLRWSSDDVSGSLNRDEFGINNLVVDDAPTTPEFSNGFLIIIPCVIFIGILVREKQKRKNF